MIIQRSIWKPLLGVAVACVVGTANAAIELDLTTVGASGDINGATYTQMPLQPTGTGVIDPFVRVGMQGAAHEQLVHAYNTTVDGVLNNSSEDTWNHEVKFGQMAIQTINGKSVLRFLLDINQNSGGTGEFLNLDDVQIFVSTSANQFTPSFGGDAVIDLAGKLVYRMDDSGTGSVPVNCTAQTKDTCNAYDGSNRVTLDYSLNSGSGSGDMYLDVPLDFFQSALESLGLTTNAQKNGAYVYLYSRFGSAPYENNDGFEEWSFIRGTGLPPNGGGGGGGVPEPSTILLAGLAILAARTASKRHRA